MFDVRFERSDKISGGWKKTTCFIFHVYEHKNRKYEELVVQADSFWNETQDEYSYKIGKKEALVRAYLQMPKSAQNEFVAWLKNL